MAHWTEGVKHDLGGSDGKKPKKEIERIVHRKSTNGDHIFEHHHRHPDHHPMETHTKRGDDEMVAHMLANAGTPNPGEAEIPPANPGADASAGADGSGAAAPAAQAAPALQGSGVAG